MAARLCFLRLCFLVVVVRFATTVAPSFAADDPFVAGFAERDISPKVGMEAPGGYGKAYHRSFHDPCKARAAVFGHGATRVAVVGIDALFIRKQSVARIRDAVHAQCGIAREAILIGASHSHSAGPVGFFLPGEFDGADPFVKELVYEKTVVANAEYLADVERWIGEAICEADAKKVPARCAVGFGNEEQAAFNRRFRMQSGFSVTHPGQGNPDIIEPAGPIDPLVGVLGAWDSDGKLLGCVVNFACHCTTGPGGISADYVYYIERSVRGVFGDQAGVVFLAGMAGDVTQVDNRSPYQIRQFGEVSSRYVGGRVGAEAVKTLLAMEQHAAPTTPVATARSMLTIKRRPPSADRVTRCVELVKKGIENVDATEWTFAKEIVILAERVRREPIVEVELQAIQVGPAVFLACPAEYFVQHGLEIRAGSKFPFTFPVSLANDCVGYVPTEEAFGPRGGGYETRLTSYSNLEPTAGRQISDGLIQLASTLTPGPVPSAPKLPEAVRKVWPYGALPPELD
ncbi:MAG: hypothetical protein FJ297_16125 [Planctomycetes bacterium]|nr:hypothetical protein [Planctomycetota bacterium]